MRKRFDNSNLPEGHPLFDSASLLNTGLWKDEAPGQIITEWICPQPRTYCFVVTADRRYKLSEEAHAKLLKHKNFKEKCGSVDGFDLSIVRKSKGIPKETARRHLTLEAMRAQTPIAGMEWRRLGPHQHRLFIERASRAVNFLDVKSYWFDGTRCLPYGHKDIPQTAVETAEPSVEETEEAQVDDAVMQDLEMGLEAALNEHDEDEDEVVFTDVDSDAD